MGASLSRGPPKRPSDFPLGFPLKPLNKGYQLETPQPAKINCLLGRDGRGSLIGFLWRPWPWPCHTALPPSPTHWDRYRQAVARYRHRKERRMEAWEFEGWDAYEQETAMNRGTNGSQVGKMGWLKSNPKLRTYQQASQRLCFVQS